MIVIDSHAWLWWVDRSPRLRDEARRRIDEEDDRRLCAISLYEIAQASGRGRLELSPSPSVWLRRAVSVERLTVEPLTPDLCHEAANLPAGMHGDPADRLIVATARLLNAELVTADGKILAYPHVRTVRADQ